MIHLTVYLWLACGNNIEEYGAIRANDFVRKF